MRREQDLSVDSLCYGEPVVTVTDKTSCKLAKHADGRCDFVVVSQRPLTKTTWLCLQVEPIDNRDWKELRSLVYKQSSRLNQRVK